MATSAAGSRSLSEPRDDAAREAMRTGVPDTVNRRPARLPAIVGTVACCPVCAVTVCCLGPSRAWPTVRWTVVTSSSEAVRRIRTVMRARPGVGSTARQNGRTEPLFSRSSWS